MDWTEEPTLKQFAECFNDYLSDVSCMNNPEGWIASHKIKGSIRVYLDNDDDDTELEITGLELDQLMGCGCSAGIIIRVKKVVDL